MNEYVKISSLNFNKRNKLNSFKSIEQEFELCNYREKVFFIKPVFNFRFFRSIYFFKIKNRFDKKTVS